MRGKVPAMHGFPAMQRITPAYAGKSYAGVRTTKNHQDHPRLCGEKCPAALRFALHWSRQDHPRLCGEKCEALSKLDYDRGSPPPMRGKARFVPIFLHFSRITPAYAGKRNPD